MPPSRCSTKWERSRRSCDISVTRAGALSASRQHDAVARQEHALGPALRLDDQIPLPAAPRRRPRRDRCPLRRSVSATTRSARLSVGRARRAAKASSARAARPSASRASTRTGALPSAVALDMAGDAPAALRLRPRGGDLGIVGEARPVGAVDLGARQRLDRELHHHGVGAERQRRRRREADTAPCGRSAACARRRPHGASLLVALKGR